MKSNSGTSASAADISSISSSYRHQLDLDFLKYVDDLQNGSTLNRVSLSKKLPGVPNPGTEPQSRTASSQSWTSFESLSSVTSYDTHVGQSAMSTVSRGKPPLPPSSGALAPSATTTPTSEGGSSTALKPQEGRLVIRPQTPRFNPLVERTLMETRRRLEQEKTGSTPAQHHPDPHPRRRLASFGGVGSSGSVSPFTGWGSYNQDNNGNINKPHAEGELPLSLHTGASLGSGGSRGSLRPSPQSSGRATPVTGLSPLHLQHVRDQMVVALQRLKELEEQVRSIPVLQVKISVLQEEKRQLVSHIKNQNQNQQEQCDVFRKRAHSMGSANQFRVGPGVRNVSEHPGEPEDGLEDRAEDHSVSGLKEFQQLTAEMEALGRTVKGGRLQARHGQKTSGSNSRALWSVGIDDDFNASSDTRFSKRDVAVETKPTETRCVATETHPGPTVVGEAELDARQRIIEALKDRVCQLEAELKESTLQTEMGRMRLELQAAGARNKADKGSTARPSTLSASTATEGLEAWPKAHTRSLGVGNHTEVRDASAGRGLQLEAWGCSVGVSCSPALRSVSSGPELPMTWWTVRERVETRDQCVGRRVVMVSQGVGAKVGVREEGVNTDPMADGQVAERRREMVSVGSGECTVVDVTTRAVKEVAVATDPPAKVVDSSVTAVPQTVSQHTNTSPTLSSVSRFTNTCRSFNTHSGTNTVLNTQERHTNTVLNTQERHTNTVHCVTRNVAIGNDTARGLTQAVAKTRSFGVGTTTPWGQNAGQQPRTATPEAVTKTTTRDTGVGMTSVNDNFLVGLKTRNFACGPSCLPDPTKTRSIGIGVGEGRVRDLTGPPPLTESQGQCQGEPGLDHYIEKMQRLLREQQGLLTESYSELGEVFNQPGSHTTTALGTSVVGSTMIEGGTEGMPSQSTDGVQSRSIPGPAQLTNTLPEGNTERSGVSQRVAKDSGVKQRILQIEHQTSSAFHAQPSNSYMLRSIMKKQDGDGGYVGTRKNLNFMGLVTGCEASTSEEEENGNEMWMEVSGQSGTDQGQYKMLANKEWDGQVGQETQERFKLSEKMQSACYALKAHLSDNKALSSRELRNCLDALQQDWFRVSSRKSASPGAVAHYLTAFRATSPAVLRHIANMADGNGNTALHYSVSHSNFAVVKLLLREDVCDVNQQNKAGYTPIMLAALAAVEASEDMEVVEELFTKGDVNAKASQAGQTALMLAVSHGRMDMVQALLAQGAEVNLQDDEGSTALMCASEHGHAEVVRLLLAQPGCSATLSDSDESTALSIALEAGHKDIALLLYAHVNFSKGQAGGTPRLGRKTPPNSAGRGVSE
ncbi:KN motif and ankyrin repeat domain-containing protein 1 isoform X1 [Esox lucius]|uniref:KN motif and ankyrin repeat domains 1b n=2 Tax=Esox lucius TaxID=8010 RepID=A0A3P8XBU4_ESOLU|nr:KN motif and ankyrin repeat domain-containing protein 1 isoform X1 [Esox lucius]